MRSNHRGEQERRKFQGDSSHDFQVSQKVQIECGWEETTDSVYYRLLFFLNFTVMRPKLVCSGFEELLRDEKMETEGFRDYSFEMEY